MTRSPLPNIIRGRMTDADRAEIHRLSALWKNPKPGPIARRINRHPATVKWYMMRHGLLTQAPGRISRPYTDRNGVTRHPWSFDQDRRLTQLLVEEGKNYREAGEILTAEFGIPRGPHNCQVRAVMLAAAPDEEAAE